MKRSLNLIAEFENGFAKGWIWAVTPAFMDALDIRLTERRKKNGWKKVIKKKNVYQKELKWTQGQNFNFHSGDVLYEGREAHSLTWIEYLKSGKYFIQIISAAPVIKNNKGFVEFALLKACYPIICNCNNPNDTDTSIVAEIKYSTQLEFIKFLQFGYLSSGNNQLLLADQSCPPTQIEGMKIQLNSITSKEKAIYDY